MAGRFAGSIGEVTALARAILCWLFRRGCLCAGGSTFSDFLDAVSSRARRLGSFSRDVAFFSMASAWGFAEGAGVALSISVSATMDAAAGEAVVAAIAIGAGEGIGNAPLFNQPASVSGPAKSRFNSGENRLPAFAIQLPACFGFPCWKAHAACA